MIRKLVKGHLSLFSRFLNNISTKITAFFIASWNVNVILDKYGERKENNV